MASMSFSATFTTSTPRKSRRALIIRRFLRLNNATLGYSLDPGLLGIGNLVNDIRLTITGQNLFTITNYTGSDPEPSLQDFGTVDNGAVLDRNNPDVLAPGVDRRYNYFQARTITLGLNINF